jgi:Dolichyl-phosphate-mannose-protein mannosyltransferase
MKNKLFVFALILLVLSSFVRLYRLASIPEGFHADEAVFGYNAYSILKTGKDEYGKPFPLILKSFGDYKGAIYSYAVVPFVAVLGLDEFTVRLPTAIFGILTVLFAMMLTYGLTRNMVLSLVTAAVVSFAPGSIVLSRVQSDPLMSVLFVYIGWYCVHKYLESKKILWSIGAISSWVIGCFIYFTPRVHLLGFIPLLFWYYYPKLERRSKIVFVVAFLCVLGTIAYLLSGSFGSRVSQVNVFSSQEVMLPLEEQIREDGVSQSPLILTRLYHNKIIDYGRYILHNYSNYFSFDFLFYQAYQPEREKMPNTGFMYIIDLPFFLVGLYLLIKQKKRWGYFIIAWFLFTPLMLSPFGQESPNFHRYYFSILPVSLIVAFGITQTVTNVRRRWRIYIIVLIAALYSFNVSYFFHELFIHQPIHLPQYRGYAYKQMVTELQQIQNNYDKIVITKAHQSPYIYLLFFMKYDPATYQRLGSPRDLDYAGFDKYLFVPLDCPNETYWQTMAREYPGKNVLYINKSGCVVTKYAKLINTVSWRDGSVAFQFVENIASKSATTVNSL